MIGNVRSRVSHLSRMIRRSTRVRRRPRHVFPAACETQEDRVLLSGYGTEQVTNIFPEDSAWASDPASFTEVNGITYFRARSPQHGTELWRTDGTEAGTWLVRDLRPGNASGLPTNLTAFGDRLFFTVNRGSGNELWSTDGTFSGTRSHMFNGIRTNVANLTVAGGKLYFTADHNSWGYELWYLDTPTTTAPALSGDLRPGAFDSDFGGFAEKDGLLYFGANGELHYANANTITTFTTNAFFRVYDLINFNGTLYVDGEGLSGKGLFKSDGTGGGTVLVKDIRGTSGQHVNLGGLMPAPGNNGIMFNAGMAGTGSEPWFSDGTNAGTIVLDINPGTSGSNPFWDPDAPANLSGYTYFYANDGTTGGELYRTDGTVAGTTLMSDSTPGVLGGMTGLAAVHAGQVFFAGDRFGPNAGLWVSDGTNAGTVPFIGGMTFRDPRHGNGVLYFSGDDGSGLSRELWSTAGTVGSTALVRDIGRDIRSSYPGSFVSHGDEVFFTAEDAEGRELWTANGSVGQVADIHPTGSSNPQEITDAGAIVLFSADDGTSGRELWKTDGTEAGTEQVQDIHAGSSSSNPYELTRSGASVFFVAETSAEGGELWVSDGTAANTNLVLDIEPGSEGAYPWDLTEFLGGVAFLAYTEASGSELWVSDGTAGGTQQLTDLHGTEDGADSIVGVFDGRLYFSALDANENIELWRTDGTVAGTEKFGDFEADGRDSFVALGDVFIFSADSMTYASDGTPAGTVPILNTDFSDPVVLDDVAYFGGYPDSGPRGLFRTDGTPEGSRLVARMPTGDVPDGLVRAGDLLAFVARDTSGRDQVWSFDGNRSSLTQITTTAWSGQQPRDPGVAGTSLYFSAYEANVGGELFGAEFMSGPGIKTAETGGVTAVDTLLGSDQFSVSLDSAPASDVVIDVTLQDADGSSVTPSVLTFTPANWDQPQFVWVTGPGEQPTSDEGDSLNAVILSINTAMSDDDYDLVPNRVVPVDVQVLPGTSFYEGFTVPDTPVTFPILGNDTPGDSVQLDGLEVPANGSATGNGDGTITYTPNGGFTGDDTFGYGVRLEQSESQPLDELQARFGNAVAVAGDVAVVGAALEDSNGTDAGAVHVLKRTGTAWQQVNVLTGSTTTAGDQFGRSVAFDGQTLVVSAPLDDDGGSKTGSVYVFERTAAGSWQETARLVDPRRRPGDEFGTDVAVSGNTIAIGARLDDGRGRNSGSAFVFNRNPTTGEWKRARTIKPDSASAFQQFGASVSLDGNTLAVGAWKDDGAATDAGAVYVFERNEGGNEKWGQVAALRSQAPEQADWFGFDVAVSGNRILAGTPLDDVQTRIDTGSVSAFHKDEEQGWQFSQMLVETRAVGKDRVFAGGSHDRFGYSVDLDENVALIGAPLDDGEGRNSGSAYAFRFDDSEWLPDQVLDKFKSANPGRYEEFGSSVALGNTRGDFVALVGTPKADLPGVSNSGAVHIEYSRVSTGTIRVTVSEDTQLAERITTESMGSTTVSLHDLHSVRSHALNAWQQFGISDSAIQQLRATPLRVFDLPSRVLGLNTDHGIVIDTDAAGHGWFIDPESTPAPDRVDLLTVLMHEYGHVLSYRDNEPGLDVMAEELPVGERRNPMASLDTVFTDKDHACWREDD